MHHLCTTSIAVQQHSLNLLVFGSFICKSVLKFLHALFCWTSFSQNAVATFHLELIYTCKEGD